MLDNFWDRPRRGESSLPFTKTSSFEMEWLNPVGFMRGLTRTYLRPRQKTSAFSLLSAAFSPPLPVGAAGQMSRPALLAGRRRGAILDGRFEASGDSTSDIFPASEHGRVVTGASTAASIWRLGDQHSTTAPKKFSSSFAPRSFAPRSSLAEQDTAVAARGRRGPHPVAAGALPELEEDPQSSAAAAPPLQEILQEVLRSRSSSAASAPHPSERSSAPYYSEIAGHLAPTLAPVPRASSPPDGPDSHPMVPIPTGTGFGVKFDVQHVSEMLAGIRAVVKFKTDAAAAGSHLGLWAAPPSPLEVRPQIIGGPGATVVQSICKCCFERHPVACDFNFRSLFNSGCPVFHGEDSRRRHMAPARNEADVRAMAGMKKEVKAAIGKEGMMGQLLGRRRDMLLVERPAVLGEKRHGDILDPPVPTTMPRHGIEDGGASSWGRERIMGTMPEDGGASSWGRERIMGRTLSRKKPMEDEEKMDVDEEGGAVSTTSASVKPKKSRTLM